MESVLLVSSAQSASQYVADLLNRDEYHPIVNARSGSEARRILSANDTFGLVVINTPLSDEFGHDLACDAARTTLAGVILLVKADRADEIAARVEEDGVFVVQKPTSRPFFFQALKLVSASRRR